jgi:hypothetical protein
MSSRMVKKHSDLFVYSPENLEEHHIVDLVVYRLDNWYNFKTISFQEQLIPKVSMRLALQC